MFNYIEIFYKLAQQYGTGASGEICDLCKDYFPYAERKGGKFICSKCRLQEQIFGDNRISNEEHEQLEEDQKTDEFFEPKYMSEDEANRLTSINKDFDYRCIVSEKLDNGWLIRVSPNSSPNHSKIYIDHEGDVWRVFNDSWELAPKKAIDIEPNWKH